jgi:hypothetical protein
VAGVGPFISCPILKDLAKTNFKIMVTLAEGSNFSQKHTGFLILSPEVDVKLSFNSF